ncbi:30047_t:CDS:1, partial [Gigaspora margarita]
FPETYQNVPTKLTYWDSGKRKMVKEKELAGCNGKISTIK